MAEIVVNAKDRTGRGKNAARRLRRQGFVPGVVYGGNGDNIAVSVDPKALQRVLRSEAGRNAILKLDITGKGATNAILKSWQVDPIKDSFLHADFYRIAMDVAIRVTVPVVAKGEARGVKVDAGILEMVLREIELECLPGDIPERIEVDVTDLGINGAARVSDLLVSAKVKVLQAPDLGFRISDLGDREGKRVPQIRNPKSEIRNLSGSSSVSATQAKNTRTLITT